MTRLEELEDDLRKDDRLKLMSRIGVIAVALAVIAALAVFSIRDYYRGNAVADLADALDQSKGQFDYCTSNPDLISTLR